MFVKYTAHEKIGVKVDQFLKIVPKFLNLNKSRRLIYKIRNFLNTIPVVLKYMPYGLNV